MDIQNALLKEELRLAHELEKIRNAIDALTGRRGHPTTGRTSSTPRRGRRRLSPAARRRIAQAQRRRWAKVRAEKKPD